MSTRMPPIGVPSLPAAEMNRIAAIASLRYAEAAEEPAFSALASVFRRVIDLPVACVTVAMTDELVLVAGAGVPTTCPTARSGTFCDTVVSTAEPLVVLDAAADPRFATSRHVVGPDNFFRFYVGIPLVTSDGHVIGTLCGFDTEPREAPDAAGIKALAEIARASVKRLELESSRRLLREREAALSRRTEILELTLNSIDQGISAVDTDLVVQLLNDKALEILELSSEFAAPGKHYREGVRETAKRGLYGPGDPDVIADQRVAAISNTKGFDIERTFADGRTVRIQCAPLPQGGFLNALTDMTHERAQEAELAYRSRYFAWHCAVDMISNEADDLDTAIRHFIEYSCDDIFYDVAHAVKMTPAGLRSTGHFYRRGEEAPQSADLDRRPLAMTTPSRLARLASRKEGAVIIIDDPVLDLGDLSPHVPATARAGFGFAARIMSDLYVFEFYGPVALTAKPSHKSIVAHVEASLSRVAERERVSRLQDELVATIGEKLKAPLGSIRSILRHIPRDEMSDEVRAMLNVADLDGRRLRHLVNNLMIVRKLDVDSGAPDRQPEDVQSLIARAVHNQGAADRVAIRFGESGIAASTHADTVVHILDNLLSNALKFSLPDTAIRVDVDRRDDLVRIAVRNRGSGIPEDFRPSVFARFVQGDSSDTRLIGGTGLGLAVSKGLAGRIGGTLDYHSAGGEETTFVLDLPAASTLSRAA